MPGFFKYMHHQCVSVRLFLVLVLQGWGRNWIMKLYLENIIMIQIASMLSCIKLLKFKLSMGVIQLLYR